MYHDVVVLEKRFSFYCLRAISEYSYVTRTLMEWANSLTSVLLKGFINLVNHVVNYSIATYKNCIRLCDCTSNNFIS